MLPHGQALSTEPGAKSDPGVVALVGKYSGLPVCFGWGSSFVKGDGAEVGPGDASPGVMTKDP